MDSIFLKLLIPFLLLMTVIVQYGIDNKWKDKRTKANKLVKKIALFLTIIFALATSAIVFVDNRSNEKLNSDINEIKKSTSDEVLIAKTREGVAVRQRKELQEKLDNLSIRIETLVSTARKYKPNLSEEEALEFISKKVDYAIQMSTRDIPKKVNLEDRGELIDSLKKWYAKNRNVGIQLKLLNGAQKNTKEALSIFVHTLKKSGINPDITTSLMGFSTDGTNFSVEYPKNREKSAKELLGILSKKFIGTVSFSEHREESIWIWINGFPEFFPDGRIVYK